MPRDESNHGRGDELNHGWSPQGKKRSVIIFLTMNRTGRVYGHEPKHPARGVLNKSSRSRVLGFVSVEELSIERHASGVVVVAHFFHR